MILEIRTYRLRPGRLGDFLEAMTATVPAQRRHDIDVVATVASLESGEGDHAVLMRAFTSVDARVEQEDAFYNSTEWVTKRRSLVMGLLVDYHTVILDVPEATVTHLRALGTSGTVDDESGVG